MNSLYRWNSDTEAIQMDGEWMILQAEHCTLTKLNEVGGAIWSHLEHPQTIESLVDLVLRDYDVTHDRALEDVMHFLESLSRIHVLDHVNG